LKTSSIYSNSSYSIATILFFFAACLITNATQAQTPNAYTTNSDGTVTAPATEKRLALVIGNNAYQHVAKLTNATNDATDLGETLKTLGFEVEVLTNVSRAQMETAITGLATKAKGANKVALFFFSGHGIESNNDNYLVPIDADVPTDADAQISCIRLSNLMTQLENANTGTNIIILDACRTNPFGYRKDNVGGLKTPTEPSGTFIGFAAAPGKPASPGTGRNSPYTNALIHAIKQPSISIEETFKQVRKEMHETTGQVSWDHSSMVGTDFYFNPSFAAKNPSTNNLTTEKQEIEKGKTAYRQKNFVLAFKLLYKNKDSEVFDASAQNFLGKMYGDDSGVLQDDTQAYRWIRKAAELGFDSAQNNLGRMYFQAKGVARDYNEAVKWFRIAAEQGNIFWSQVF
jgi:hypothetical protein